jgi:hypothetical protein
MIYLRLLSIGISPVKPSVAGDKTGSATRRQDFAPGKTPFTDERKAAGRLEANQSEMLPGANSDLNLSFMAALAAHMPQMKTGFLCAGK